MEGGSALGAVTEAVHLLGECLLFNAGKGAMLASTGTCELDASITDGATLAAGAVTCVRCPRNPILAARTVMECSKHVLFTSEGVEVFAQAQGLGFVEPDYYYIEARYTQWQRTCQQEGVALLDHDAASPMAKEAAPIDPSSRFGTVSAVACNAQGRLMTATSTGGVTSGKVGHVDDAPIVGAGYFANSVAAVSCTGTGEMSIRAVAAYDIAARMEYTDESLADASNDMIMRKLMAISSRGGPITMGAQGNATLLLNAEGCTADSYAARKYSWCQSIDKKPPSRTAGGLS